MPSATSCVNSTEISSNPAGRLEPGFVLALREGAGDAADVAAAFGPLLGGESVFGDDVADADPAARCAGYFLRPRELDSLGMPRLIAHMNRLAPPARGAPARARDEESLRKREKNGSEVGEK